MATLLLGLAVFAVVSLIRSGGIAEKRNDLRRQAVRILQSALEDTTNHISKHPVTLIAPAPEDCVLDASRAVPVPCQLSLSFAMSSIYLGNPNDPTSYRPISYRRISGMLKWTSEGREDSVTLARSTSEVFWREP